MNTLIHADIFFFITSVIVVLFGIFGVIILYYGIKIMQQVKHIVDKVKEESDHVSDDIAEIRERIKESGSKLSSVLGSLAMFFIGKAVKRRSKSKKSEDED